MSAGGGIVRKERAWRALQKDRKKAKRKRKDERGEKEEEEYFASKVILSNTYYCIEGIIDVLI